jgi:predicted ester cyclase
MLYKGLINAASGLEKQRLEAYWANDFMWYGPAGIGSTKGIKGFKEYHQGPFMMLPLTQFDAAILTANNGRIIATVCHKVENSGANQSLAR